MSPTPVRTVITNQLLVAQQNYLTRLMTADPPPQVSASGTYDTLIAVMLVDADVVGDALPDGITLQPDAYTPLGQHPVILTLGTEISVIVKDLPGQLDYNEAIVAVPNVSVEGFENDGLACYPTRIEVDDTIALTLGWAIGLPKELSVINVSANTYSVRSLLTRVEILSDSSVTLKGGTKPGDFPDFQYVAGLMRQPIVSRDVAGQFLFSAFRWDFAGAELVQTNAHFTVDRNLPALPAGQYKLHGFGSRLFGSGQLRVHWDLSGPFQTWPPPGAF